MMRVLLILLALALSAGTGRAHVGSPDLFYNGPVGPYPARVTIRMPRVIPGRAEISVRVEASAPVDVSFLPLYAKTDIKNAPPPDRGELVQGEANLYSGELWLMSFGAYSVEVRIKGPQGEGSVQIPLTSVATSQLPMPPILGNVLAALGGILVFGAVAIARAAAREATLATGQAAGKSERRKGFAAAAVTLVILTGGLYGGWHWWKAEEGDFRRHLREGAWPELQADVAVRDGARILRLTLGKEAAGPSYFIPPLIPDHGKLMHLFLIREGQRDTFAHVHPARKGPRQFEVALPPLPGGRYTVFCDLSYEGGTSSTAMTSVEVPAVSGALGGTQSAGADPDDSWATYPEDAVPTAADPNPIFRLPDGATVAWKAEQPLRVQKDASLKFEISDADGRPIALEPYMGMLSHAAVLRADGAVFAHLHPAGNYSMAAQSFFAAKLAREAAGRGGQVKSPAAGRDHSAHHGHGSPAAAPPGPHSEHAAHHQPGTPAPTGSVLYLPYEFPEDGDYRIWVQFKTAGRIFTAAFDAHVQ